MKKIEMIGAIFQFARMPIFALCALCLVLAPSTPVQAAGKADAFARTLATVERGKFERWYKEQVFHAAAMDAYWAKVDKKRRWRRTKRRRKQSFVSNDYVTTYPPDYQGTKIGRSLLKRWRRFRDGSNAGKPRTRRGLPGLNVYLAAARRYYKFAPERIPEREFKRRYALEALRLGLTKDQVVRVYALETGGRGTADMQAGIHPITRKGEPISSALGYAQLLAANSVNVLSKHGPGMVTRLAGMVGAAREVEQQVKLQSKLNALRLMVRAAKSIPYKWSRHRAFARTPRGQGLHVMNMDGDIGPWMQVVKLASLKRMAARKGRAELSGAEIELMNLAGPATGLEMMLTTGIDKPTTNFFSRRAYYRNTVVRGKDSRGLLAALERRMQAGLKQAGAREFLAVFDEVERQQSGKVPASRADARPFGFTTNTFRPRN